MIITSSNWFVKSAVGWYIDSWMCAHSFLCRQCGDNIVRTIKGGVRAIYSGSELLPVVCEMCGVEVY